MQFITNMIFFVPSLSPYYMMMMKLLIIIVTIHGAACVFNYPTLGWKRDNYITMRPKFGYTRLKDGMGNAEKSFITNITFELVRDARLKTRQTAGLKKDYALLMGYHVGLIVGKIREKYRNMLDLYREGQDHRHERMLPNVPGIRADRVEHYFFYFELVRKYEIHIDHLVHVIEGISEEDWPGNEGMINPSVYSTSRPYGRRFNKMDQFGYENRIIKEQKLKKNMRQKFLMKKMGRPLNASTTQKRFVNQWPVMKTWSDYFAKMY